jgi:hypothetical protein
MRLSNGKILIIAFGVDSAVDEINLRTTEVQFMTKSGSVRQD